MVKKKRKPAKRRRSSEHDFIRRTESAVKLMPAITVAELREMLGMLAQAQQVPLTEGAPVSAINLTTVRVHTGFWEGLLGLLGLRRCSRTRGRRGCNGVQTALP